MSVASIVGAVIYAYYADKGCDPLAAGILSNPNQVNILLNMVLQGEHSKTWRFTEALWKYPCFLESGLFNV